MNHHFVVGKLLFNKNSKRYLFKEYGIVFFSPSKERHIEINMMFIGEQYLLPGYDNGER